MKNALVSFVLVCCALLGVVISNSGEAFAAESFTAAAASAAADKALADVPHVRSDQRAELLKAMERGDIVAQKAILQDIRAVSDTEEKLIKLRSSVSKLREQVEKCQSAPTPASNDKCGAEAEAKLRDSIKDVKIALKKHNGRLGRMQSSMVKVVDACAALEARLDKVEARIGVAERDIVQVKAETAGVKADVVRAQDTANDAKVKAEDAVAIAKAVATRESGGIDFGSNLSFGARKGIGSAENAVGFGLCGMSSRSGFGGCAELSLGFTGLGGGKPAPTSAVIEVGPRWSIGSPASPLTFDLRGLLGFGSQTQLSDERYAGMSGGVKAAMNFNLSKISVLPVELSVDAGQVWGMYSGWVAGVKASIDLGAATKLVQ